MGHREFHGPHGKGMGHNWKIVWVRNKLHGSREECMGHGINVLSPENRLCLGRIPWVTGDMLDHGRHAGSRDMSHLNTVLVYGNCRAHRTARGTGEL